MKVAYISYFGRPCYEFGWLAKLDAQKIKFIDVDFSSYPKEPGEKIEYCQVGYSENRLFKNRFHSSARMLKYNNFEKHLKDVDVVIVLEVFSSLSHQFVEYCKNNNKKCVVIVYELIARHPLNFLPTHYFNRKYSIRNADHFVCVSNKAKESLLRLGAKDERVSVVYPGIDMAIFGLVAQKEPSKNILFVGGLKEHKGIDLFLRLADELMLDGSTGMGVVGDGPFSKMVQEYADKYDNFIYYGRVANSSLPDIFCKYGVYLMPCREMSRFGIKITAEQFGFSFVEAMASGLAVITTECGAIPEIVTNNNIVVKQDDYESLRSETRDLLLVQDRIARIGRENIEIARERYDVGEQAKALFDVLRNLI